MTASEELLNEAVRLGLVLDRLAQHSFDTVLEKLVALRDELAVLVIRIDPTAVVRDSARRARLEALIERTDQAILNAYGDIQRQVDQDLDNVGTLTQDSLSVLLAILLLIKGLSREMDRPARVDARKDTLIEGATVADWWDQQAVDMQFRVRRVLEDALRMTQIGKEPGTGDLVAAIRDTAPGSLFSAPPRHAEGLIIGAHHAVANRIRFEIILRHPELFRAFMHVSVLDGRTTKVCKMRANRLWSLEGVPIGHTLPFARTPLHWRCRSHLIAVLHPFDDLPPRLQRRVRKEDFDGKSPREPDIAEWLDLRGEERDPGPLDYPSARKLLGL
jgi:hypothetical protein